MKKIETTITCDGCEEIILPAQGCDGFYLNLSAYEYSEYRSNVSLGVMIHPPLDRHMQFHSIECLKKWVAK